MLVCINELNSLSEYGNCIPAIGSTAVMTRSSIMKSYIPTAHRFFQRLTSLQLHFLPTPSIIRLNIASDGHLNGHFVLEMMMLMMMMMMMS